MDILLHPTYFGSISSYVAMIQYEDIFYESDDNFQKQTNRNRMYVCGSNGLQLLNIPVKHLNKNAHQRYKDIQIENDVNWQKQHFKTLEACYRTSPFFEYFEEDLLPIFKKKYSFLFDLNLEIHQVIAQCLNLELPFTLTEEYYKTPSQADGRVLANGKKDLNQFECYTQVFDDKNEFYNNLSILDLLFNEGRYAVDYLKKQKLQL